jgi:serine protease Do
MQKKEHKKSGVSGFVRAVCIVLVCVLLSGAAAYGVLEYRIENGDLNITNQVVLGSGTTTAEDNGGATNTASSSGNTMTSADIYDMACQQVVGVNTDVTTNVFGQTSSTAVSGSGFIISTDGYILTNYHVVEYAAQYGYDLTVMLYDGTSYDATITAMRKKTTWPSSRSTRRASIP